MPTTPEGLASVAAAIFVCGYALWRGRLPEIAAALALLVATLAVVLAQDHVHWLDPQRRLLAIDAALAVVFAVLTSISRRTWTLFACALQLLAVMIHFVVLYEHVWAYTYILIESLLTYGVLSALAFGTWQVDRRRRAILAGAGEEAVRLLALFRSPDEAFEVAERRTRETEGIARERAFVVRDIIAEKVWPNSRNDHGWSRRP